MISSFINLNTLKLIFLIYIGVLKGHVFSMAISYGVLIKVDKDEIGKVQRYATSLTPSIKHIPYEEHL